MTRPSILVIAPTTPAPTGTGLAMRIGLFVEALARVGRVDVVVVALYGLPDAAARAWLDRVADHVTVIDPGDRLDSHFGLVARIVDPDARADAFARYGRPSVSGRLSVAVAIEIAEAIAGRPYDLVHVARSYMAPLALALPLAAEGRQPCLTLDADEDDARLARRQAAERRLAGDTAAARLLDLEAVAHARLHADVLRRFAAVWTSSHLEGRSLAARAPGTPLRVMENGAAGAPDGGRAWRHAGRPRLLFVGALGYGPNREGLTWFLTRVWPHLRRSAEVDLDIVGATPCEALRRLARRPGVHLHGFQPDLAPFYRRATLAIAPLRTGVGTRIKIIEAAAHAVPVVATSVAAEALPLRHGRDIWLADTPEAFVSAILDGLRHPAKRQRIGAAARAAIRREHDRRRLVTRIAQQIERLLLRG